MKPVALIFSCSFIILLSSCKIIRPANILKNNHSSQGGQSLDQQSVVPKWFYGEWNTGVCQNSSQRLRNRTATCRDSTNNSPLINTECDQISKEETELLISDPVCATVFRWELSSWNNGLCTSNTERPQTRTATCKNTTNNTTPTPSSVCGQQTLPLTQNIADATCSQSFLWQYSSWTNGNCLNDSQRTQTRTATCKNTQNNLVATPATLCGEQLPLSQVVTDNTCPYTTNLGLPLWRPITPVQDIVGPLSGDGLIPNDALYATHQFSLHQISLKSLNAPLAWHKNTDCRDINIGIVDSGIDSNHFDLMQNYFKGMNFVTGGSSNNVMDEGTSHGTHVAGIIAAAGNNSVGIAGVCWQAKLVIAKVMDGTGSGSMSQIIRGFEYTLNENSRVINASLGGEVLNTTLTQHQSYDNLFSGVTALAAQKDSLIVAAAGNSSLNNDISRSYPASLVHKQIVSVANTHGGILHASSNWGGGTVHLSAPGTNILSTTNVIPGNPNSALGYKTGTSMAAPHVSGALALLWTHIGPATINSQDLLKLLLNNTDKHSGDLGTPGSKLVTGSGLDLGRAMLAAEKIYFNR